MNKAHDYTLVYLINAESVTRNELIFGATDDIEKAYEYAHSFSSDYEILIEAEYADKSAIEILYEGDSYEWQGENIFDYLSFSPYNEIIRSYLYDCDFSLLGYTYYKNSDEEDEGIEVFSWDRLDCYRSKIFYKKGMSFEDFYKNLLNDIELIEN